VKKLLVPIPVLCLLLAGCVLASPRLTPTPTLPPTATTAPTATVPAPTATPATEQASTATPPAAEPTATGAASSFSWDDVASYERAMLPAYTGDVEQFGAATHYLIDLRVDIAAKTFAGQERVRYTNQESVPLEQIVFRLLPNTPGYGGSMTVSSVTVNGTAIDTRLELSDSALYVPLAAPLQPGEQIELDLAFSGSVPTDASAGYAQYGYFAGVLALPDVYPYIPVYDDEGWNVELAPSYGDATFTDTALYLVRITLPADMVLATSGVTLDRQDNGDGTATYTCASGPMRDFNLVASANYETTSQMVGQVKVTSYFLSGDDSGGQRALDYTAQSLNIYERLFGPYPFTELDVMATPTQAGGIEYPGLIVVAEGLYGQTGSFFEFATVHETAHQWWYSLVGNDQLDEPWLDESLAQYTSLLYFEQRYGEAAAQSVLQNSFEAPYRRLQQQHQDMPVGLPVAAYPEDLYAAVVYGKGPLFFQALREQVGDETFYRILSTYFEQYRYEVAYPQDFMAVAESVSGQQLDALYDKWILGKG
jgi:aminopeptidase N